MASCMRGPNVSARTTGMGTQRGTVRLIAWAAAALVALAVLTGTVVYLHSSRATAPAEPVERHRYDVEYPAMGYTTAPLSGRIDALEARLGAGDLDLDFDPVRGYLDDLLAALDIDPSSQTLVYSKTSLQVGNIAPETPRAIYFNDDTYVAWVQGTTMLEIASLDPVLGPVFHTLGQDPASAPRLERQMNRCLRCHDSYSLTGGGVPRFLLGSGYTGADGELVSHEGWILVTDRTPFSSRWGGWYVSGLNGDNAHLGNIVVHNVEELQDLESLRIDDLPNLDPVLDTSRYPTNTSDIVALLVLEHQVTVQNLLTRLGWEARTLLDGRPDATWDTLTDTERATIAEHAEPLVEAMTFAGAAHFEGPIEGTSGFAERFERLGPADAEGRSLRDLDLSGRMFRYPLSYVVYSDAFEALPAVARTYVLGRIGEILRGDGEGGRLAAFDPADAAAALEILEETRPEYRPALTRR